MGTGTGAWALDYADLHPEATVIGTDLSPIQPSFVPPNLHFEIDDCCDEWLYKRPFDFIHVRGLFGSVSDWDRFYDQALQNLKPGGYLEQVEWSVAVDSDDGSANDTTIAAAGQVSLQSCDKFGKSARTVDEMEQNMVNAGFTDVTVHSFKIPIGPWPKDKRLKTLGRYQRLVWEESLEMWVMFLWTKVLGVSIYPNRPRSIPQLTPSLYTSGREKRSRYILHMSEKTCATRIFIHTRQRTSFSFIALSFIDGPPGGSATDGNQRPSTCDCTHGSTDGLFIGRIFTVSCH